MFNEIKSLLSNTGRHKLLISNISWQGIESGTRMLAGVFTGILLASYLGPSALGIYSYAMSFVLLFSPLLSLGYDGYLVRDIIFQKEKWADILGSAALLKFLGSIVSIGLIWAIVFFDNSLPIPSKMIIRVLSLSFIFYPFDVFDIWFRAKLQAKVASVAKVIALILINSIKIWFIYEKEPLLSFAWLYVAEFIVNGCLQFYFYHRLEPGSLKKWMVTGIRIRFVMAESWPLLVSTFSFMIYNRIDQIMIGRMLDDEKVGIFSAAGKISEMPLALIMVLNASLYPFLADSYKSQMPVFQRQYKLITAMYTVISYIMIIIVLFTSGRILNIYPSSFASGKNVLIINFIGLIFLFNSALRNSYLSLTGNQRYLLFSAVASAFINILLNLYMIPMYGIDGAAWASTITEFFALFLLNAPFSATRYIFKVQARELLLLSFLRNDKQGSS